MSYRTAICPPGSTSWIDGEWLAWLRDDRRLLPVAGAPKPVCRLCHGPVNDDWPRCYPCSQEIRPHLSGLLTATYSTADTFEPLVWGVKDNGQRWLERPLGALVDSLLTNHLPHADRRFGTSTLLTVVPAHPQVRGGYDHVRSIVEPYQARPWAKQRLRLDVLRRTRPKRDGRKVDRSLFEVTDPSLVQGHRVAIIDDTFTRGGTLASAAAALIDAGAGRVIGITLGRQLNPTYTLSGPLIASQTAAVYDLGKCTFE